MNDPLLQLQASSGMSLGTFVSILRKRLWLIVGIVVAVPSLVAFFVSKQPKIYEASASLIIDSSVPQYMGPNFKDVVEIESNWWDAQETLQTELRVIRSYSTAEAVAKSLCTQHLKDGRVAFGVLVPDGDCGKSEDIKHGAQAIQRMMNTTPIQQSRIVNITVRHNEPEFAALLANGVGQIYSERNLARRLSQSEGAATWLGDEYGDLTQQLEDAERALIDFKKKNNVVAVGIEDQQNDVSNQRRKLSDELSAVQVKLIAARVMRSEFEKLKSDDPLEDIAPILADGLATGEGMLQKLREFYLDQLHRLTELRGKYLEKHPLVLAQEARVESARADLVREAALQSKGLESKYGMLVRQEHDLRAAIDQTTREALQLEQRAIEFRDLKRNYDRLAKLSEQVGGRERETSLAGHLKTNNVRPLDPALVPSAAVGPDVPKAVGGSLAVALLLAVGLAFLLEMLDSTVKDQDTIEHRIGLSFLGLIPSINLNAKERTGSVPLPPAQSELARSGPKDLYVLSHPKSAVAECCRAIRTNLLFMTPDNPARKLLVTSAGSQEGKTTTAVSLAVVLAQSGLRVLLVDTDMRRPRLHKVFGVPATSDGLSRAILGEVPVLEQVRETGVPNLSLLPCGATPPNPAELLHAERFKKIVSELESSFDRVVFDSPPVGPVTDAAILARLTDGTIIVAKFGETSKDGLLRARRQLVDGGVNVLGCILNDLDLAQGQKYGYYAGKYGYYYGDESDAPGKQQSAAG
jgi:capsular exopolysaccharide synthesis family protein